MQPHRERSCTPTVDFGEPGDGMVSQEEMNTTGLLTPADLCNPSLRSMLDQLRLKADPQSLEAAAILEDDSDSSI